MNLTYEQIRKYFELRLDRSIPAREKVAVLCPFHSDSTPSATIFLSGNGGFNCNGCQIKGNTFQFEARYSNCDFDTARKNIAEITGADLDAAGSAGRCTGVYDFRKADGSIAFQKRRYARPDGSKTFRIYRPEGNGWRDGLSDDTTRVPFNLPQLVTANLVLVAEGEKDCETLAQVSPWPERPDLRIAATTNFEGAWQPGQAPKWLECYSRYFAGKVVIVFEDNDDAGRAWADHVCASVHPVAEMVRRVTFRDMAPKSDVSDWMQEHTVEDLRKLIIGANTWKPQSEEASNRELFVGFADFCTQSSEQIQWLVQSVIQRGANGFIAASPKGSKSFCSADLAISLATGLPWLDFPVPQPVKVGIVSREDNAELTSWRLQHLMRGKELNAVQMGMLERNLYINTRRQTPTLMLDNEEELNELIAETKKRGLEFLVLDVFNILHSADENDNSQMASVLRHCRRIQTETGAAVGIIHHYNKDTAGSITGRLRGASAIAGFAEWIIGISMHDEDTRIRKMEFESKAGAPEPIYFGISAEEGQPARIQRIAIEAGMSRNTRVSKGVN